MSRGAELVTSTQDLAITPAWSALFPLIHPAQIAVVEAFEWIGEPMSVNVLEEVLDRAFPLGIVNYHLRQLAGAGVVVEHHRIGRRRPYECFYLLAT
jgi:Helix-turn-helix domain